MPAVGETTIRDGKKYVHLGYDVWALSIESETLVNKQGVPLDVLQDNNTGDYGLEVIMPGHVCECNSTNAALAAGGVFLGSDFQSCLDYGVISIGVSTDTDSATDGLEVQWSNDGINVDNTDLFSILAGQSKTFTFGPANLYVRLKYTNGAVAQTKFNLSTILRKTYVKPSSHRIKDSIVGDDDAELMSSVLKVQTNNEDRYVNVDVQNPLPVDGDSVYGKDLLLSLSDPGDFYLTDNLSADSVDILTSIVSNVDREKKNDTSNPVKSIILAFRRPVVTNSFGIDSGPNGTFSNVKVTIYQGQYSAVVVDESADNTAYKIRLFDIVPQKFSKILIEFHTTNTVTIGLVGIFKSIDTTSRIQGQSPDGTIKDFQATRKGNFKVSLDEYGDTPSIDAFARLRVSDNFTIFDSKQLHDKQPLFWDESLGGSATSTHNSANASVEMTVTANTSDFAIRQTKQRFNYQPGKSQLIFMTFYCPQIQGTTKRIGIFSGTGTNNLTPYNGIFFQTDGDLSWNIAKNGVTVENASQSSWNLDTLDGSSDENNPSGIAYVSASTQILIIDFEWLGVGRVRTGFVIDGIIRYVHYFNHANSASFTSVYMSTPNLPLRYDMQSDGTAGGGLDHICSTVISEGGVQENGLLRSVDTGFTHIDASATDTTYAVLGIRLKSAYLDVTVFPEYFSMVDEQGNAFRWSLQLNPSIAGTFTYSDITNSAIQAATGVTANTITTPGILFDSGYVGSGGVNAGAGSSRQFSTSLRMGTTIAGVSDELVLCVTPLGANSDIQASLTFRELL